MKGKFIVYAGAAYLLINKAAGIVRATDDPAPRGGDNDTIRLNQEDIGFAIPDLTDFLSFMVKFFFVLAGLLALFYMLWGALSWVTSGGDKDAVSKARDKIVAAAVGVILIVATLAIIAGLEQIVFKGRVCFGLTCELKLPTLLKCPDEAESEPDEEGRCPGEPGYTAPSTDGASDDEESTINSGGGQLPNTGRN